MKQKTLFNLSTPTMNRLDTNRIYAKLVNYKTAKIISEKYHYAKRVPSIVVAVGMYVDDILAGIVTYGIPPNRNALGFCGEKYIPNALELNRLYVHDWAGRNSESWLIGQSFKLLEKFYPQYYLLISYADPSQDHIGYIYQATNWIYTGTGSPGNSDVIVNGTKISEKHLYNLWGTHDRTKLSEMGLNIENIMSPGKHRYVYFLGNRTQRRKMKKLLLWQEKPYPKKTKVEL
jgi:hypothetical protein